jgi:hypothetical protein
MCRQRILIFLSLVRSGLSDVPASRTPSDDSDKHSSNDAQPALAPPVKEDENVDDDDEEFVYPTTSSPTHAHSAAAHVASSSEANTRKASSAVLETVYAAAASGDLQSLKTLFREALDGGDVEAFALANDATPRTGLTALHAAASRGHFDIVTWRACFHHCR